MKKLVLVFAVAIAACSGQPAQQTNAPDSEVARWEQQAHNVTIIRDNWGIPHIYGKTDADAVFGVMYAQAEDDFNRVEVNYLNGMGRLAESEGETEIYRDLRMKLFIDPEDLKRQYESSPDWLKRLMDAYADGLNYYLHTHPEVEPKVLTHFEPWMALSFSEGSIGGDIERVSLRELEAFYGNDPGITLARATRARDEEPRGSNGFAIAPSNSASGKALLYINPHTSFFFRAEVHMVSEEGLNAYGAVTWGQFFVYQGFSEKAGWMHTSSRADAIDEYLETVIEKDGGFVYTYDDEERPLKTTTLSIPYKSDDGMEQRAFTVYHSHHGPIIREQDGKWVSISLIGRARQSHHPILPAHEGHRARRVLQNDGAIDELFEQHRLCRRGRKHRLLPRQLHSATRPQIRLECSPGRLQPGDGVARATSRGRDHHDLEPAQRLDSKHQQLALLGGGTPQSQERGLPELHGEQL